MGFMKRMSTSNLLVKSKRAIGRRDGFHVSYEMFFDRAGVIARLERKELAILSRTGAWTMTAMRRSFRKASPRTDRIKADLRRRGRHAQARSIGAGKPPRYRFGDIRNKTYFGLDRNRISVVVGPYAYKSSGVTVPQLLHEGGRAAVVMPGGEREQGRYLPRPYAAGSEVHEKAIDFFQDITEEVPL